mmetsp:Transcript_2172/g.2922  ORF Transcript_2172/g.2922 Transcript_2172/m.2922 type:complete len:380 (-) Transcript_2172:328-1467(-)
MKSFYLLAIIFLSTKCPEAFHVGLPEERLHRSTETRRMSTKSLTADIGDSIASLIVKSPVYGLLVKQAQDTMKKSAKGVGVQWDQELEELQAVGNWEDRMKAVIDSAPGEVEVPEYYYQPFHTYPDGNLCWKAAFEQELASKAVGVRNFPDEGIRGEDVLRESLHTEMDKLGVLVPKGGTVVDMGCGTGSSTRKLAEKFTEAKELIGFDLSAQMLAVGRHFNEVRNVDYRVSLEYADMAATPLEDNSVDLVVFSLVFHELPHQAVKDCLREAHRILRPGGSVAIMEMDPEAPGYVKLRENPFLFSIIRSTEPYLDEWFKMAPTVQNDAAEVGFAVIRKTGATGRHFALVATKAGYIDARPSNLDRVQMDQHLNTLKTSA